MVVLETQGTMAAAEQMAGYPRAVVVDIQDLYKQRWQRNGRGAGTQRQIDAKDTGW